MVDVAGKEKPPEVTLAAAAGPAGATNAAGIINFSTRKQLDNIPEHVLDTFSLLCRGEGRNGHAPLPGDYEQAAKILEAVDPKHRLITPHLLRTTLETLGMDADGMLRAIAARAAEAAPKEFHPKTWADVEDQIKDVSFDWKDWLAKAFFTLLVAFSGIGKSGLLLRICGSYINRWDWPDGTPFEGESKAVLWCESEFAEALNISRAKAWGIPTERIYTPFEDPTLPVELDNEVHRMAIYQMALRDDVGLIAIDSYSGSTSKDENKSESAKIGFWLAGLSRDTGKPVVCSHHLGKRSMFDTSKPITLDMVRGHSGIVQPARVVWAMDVPDPMSPNRKRLSVIKSNLGRFPEPVGLTISENGVQFGEAPLPPRQETQEDKACDLIQTQLRQRPVKTKELEAAAEAKGISVGTLRRAKKRLGIVDFRKDDVWWWSLPNRETQ